MDRHSLIWVKCERKTCKIQKNCHRPWRPIGLWDVEASTFSIQSAHRWRWGCQPYASAGLHPQEASWYSFLLEAESDVTVCQDWAARNGWDTADRRLTEKNPGARIQDRENKVQDCVTSICSSAWWKSNQSLQLIRNPVITRIRATVCSRPRNLNNFESCGKTATIVLRHWTWDNISLH
jgi:hypothetical protein